MIKNNLHDFVPIGHRLVSDMPTRGTRSITYCLLCLAIFYLQPIMLIAPVHASQKNPVAMKAIDFRSKQSLGVLFVYKNIPDEDCQTSRVTSGKFVCKALAKAKFKMNSPERLGIVVSRLGLEHPESIEKIAPNSFDAMIIDSVGRYDEETEDPRLTKALFFAYQS